MAQDETVLRAWAAGKACQLRINPGVVCMNDVDTTVLCHLPSGVQYGKGLGFKPPDLFGAIGCAACHRITDEPRYPFTLDAIELLFLQAIIRTQLMALEDGIITIGNPDV